jgi:formylglycine-generating enzyme required for sulfatase activity
VLAVGLGVPAYGCSQKPASLPPYGQVVIEADTDLPVPQMVNRVRVDVYAQDGSWLVSRDILRANPQDWPLSFTVYSDDETQPRDVLVRLRAYPDARVRDYTGERFQDIAAFQDVEPASTVVDLCKSPPVLARGVPTTARLGAQPLTGPVAQATDTNSFPDGGTNDCTAGVDANIGGAAAFSFTVPVAGTYRFDVQNSVPESVQPFLVIRKTCADSSSQVTCAYQVNAAAAQNLFSNTTGSGWAYTWPSLVTTLDAGTYTLLVTEGNLTPARITVRWGVPGDFATASSGPDAGADAGEGAGEPRLIVNGVDETPPQEPVPQTAVDRLLRLHITPGQVSRDRVVLRGSCMGTMAMLSTAASLAPPVIGQAETCISTEATRSPVPLEAVIPDTGASSASIQGTFAPQEPCAASDDTPYAACVPAGVFLLGSLKAAYGGQFSTVPERPALLHKFWLDKDEFSVDRYRALLAKGFVSPDATPPSNSGPLPPDATTAYYDSYLNLCTWSLDPLSGDLSRENYALNCGTWYAARAICQALGGDLPTEAQWEYAATVVGRPAKTQWPWGGDDDQTVGCDRAVIGHDDPLNYPFKQAPPETICFPAWYGPAPLSTDISQTGDVSLGLQLRNLEGGMYEWMLDSFYGYGDACWLGATIDSPLCWERAAAERTLRGQAWDSYASPTVSRFGSRPGGSTFDDVSFRCAYAAPPKSGGP